jgi:hypothetical protein
MFRFIRRMFRPFGRTATVLLLWEHRKSTAMAARSIKHEIDNTRRTGLDTGRWKTLLAGIWRARRAAEKGAVKSVIVDDAQRVVPLATNPTVTPSEADAPEWAHAS